MNGMYYQNIDITDHGPYVTKLVLCMPRAVRADELTDNTFNVFVRVRDKQGRPVRCPKSFLERDVFVPSEGYRPVTRVYPCDLMGNEKETGDCVAVEMPYGPIWKCSSALTSDHTNINGHGHYVFCDYRVTQLAPIGTGDEPLVGLVFDRCAGIRNPKTERFSIGCCEKVGMRYGYYLPEIGHGKRPLIIFLHGAGEGGFDTPIAWSGNKVTALADEHIQTLMGGATVLVPQCDTMWMDDGSHEYGDSGLSMYTEDLKTLIDEFMAAHAEVVDEDRVYIGGDSNGGFMTMRMLMSYPGFFAAAYPICEAMPDKRVTDAQIESMVNTAIWFTHSSDDPVVIPEETVLPAYRRLIKAGAKNVHLTYWNGIFDKHEGFKDEKGDPYRYMGHFAWVPLLNDDCRLDYNGKPVTLGGKEVTLMEWMAAQHR